MVLQHLYFLGVLATHGGASGRVRQEDLVWGQFGLYDFVVEKEEEANKRWWEGEKDGRWGGKKESRWETRKREKRDTPPQFRQVTKMCWEALGKQECRKSSPTMGRLWSDLRGWKACPQVGVLQQLERGNRNPLTNLLLFVYDSVPVHLSVSTQCVWGAFRGQKRTMEPLELSLEAVEAAQYGCWESNTRLLQGQ